MQYDLETTDTSLDLFGSAKSKLIDDKISNKKEKTFLLMLRASTSAKNFLVSKNARTITIFIGKGNNGEDGLCLAALLKIENIKTHIIDLEYKDRSESHAYRLCINLGVKFGFFSIVFVSTSITICLFGYSGVKLSKAILCLDFSGSSRFILLT